MWKLKANLFGKMEGRKGKELLKSHSYKVVKILQTISIYGVLLLI